MEVGAILSNIVCVVDQYLDPQPSSPHPRRPTANLPLVSVGILEKHGVISRRIIVAILRPFDGARPASTTMFPSRLTSSSLSAQKAHIKFGLLFLLMAEKIARPGSTYPRFLTPFCFLLQLPGEPFGIKTGARDKKGSQDDQGRQCGVKTGEQLKMQAMNS